MCVDLILYSREQLAKEEAAMRKKNKNNQREEEEETTDSPVTIGMSIEKDEVGQHLYLPVSISLYVDLSLSVSLFELISSSSSSSSSLLTGNSSLHYSLSFFLFLSFCLNSFSPSELFLALPFFLSQPEEGRSFDFIAWDLSR